MRGSGSFTALKESRRYRGRARSRHTSCAIARATPSVSTSRRCTTGRSPATWTGRWRRWKRGRRPSRAIPHLTDCWPAFATRSTGKYEQSIAAAERQMAVDPEGGSALSHGNKAYSELYLNRLDAAEATIRRAEDRKLASEEFSVLRYYIAFLRGDGEGMSQQAAMARARRSTEDLMSHLEALRLAGSARLQDARRTSAIAAAIAQAVREARAGRLVRSGHRGVGSVLRKCRGCQTEGGHGPLARQRP